MAFRRPAPRLAKNSPAQPEEESLEHLAPPAPLPALHQSETRVVERDWSGDESDLLDEALRCHSLPEALLERLKELAAAPVHTARVVDRLAVALAAHFHFLSLDEALAAPVLLYGMAGSGVSTVAAKLAAKWDDSEVLVISVNPGNREAVAPLEENLEALGLPLKIAGDATVLRSLVASANGRKVIIDAGAVATSEKAGTSRMQQLSEAAGAASIMVLAASATNEDAMAMARIATRIGTGRMIVTQIDSSRYIGPVLIAADAGKLAFIAASVTPHFAFGIRNLSPENLARRLAAAALRTERWRVAPL